MATASSLPPQWQGAQWIESRGTVWRNSKPCACSSQVQSDRHGKEHVIYFVSLCSLIAAWTGVSICLAHCLPVNVYVCARARLCVCEGVCLCPCMSLCVGGERERERAQRCVPM